MGIKTLRRDTFTFAVDAEMKKLIVELAEKGECSTGAVVRRVLKKGFEAMRKDGILK